MSVLAPTREKRRTSSGVPALAAGDAEVAPQIATAEGNGENGDELQFIGDIGLGVKDAGFRASATGAGFARETVRAAAMRAELAMS